MTEDGSRRDRVERISGLICLAIAAVGISLAAVSDRWLSITGGILIVIFAAVIFAVINLRPSAIDE